MADHHAYILPRLVQLATEMDSEDGEKLPIVVGFAEVKARPDLPYLSKDRMSSLNVRRKIYLFSFVSADTIRA